MKLGKQMGALLVLSCFVLGGSALAVQLTDPDSTVRLNRFKFSESLRKEIKTESSFNSSSTESAEGGQATLEFELPLSSVENNGFAPSTPFVVKAGSLEFRSTLDQDPDYRPGANSAVLKITSGTSADRNHIVFATASLHWDKKKLSVKIDAKTPAVHNIAAGDFVGGLRGPIDGETKVTILFGDNPGSATVPFHGKLDHIVRETIGLKGEVITVNLRGELKKP